jgi:hypothetical protein
LFVPTNHLYDRIGPETKGVSQMITSDELKRRLLTRIAIDPVSGCWNWTASKDLHGYGHLNAGGKIRRAHRASYEVHRGPIQPGMQVCHRCDNRLCINPAHLFQGTWRDNMLDKLAKGRQSRNKMLGETNPHSKLSADSIRAIRSAVGVKQKDLAEKYGVARAHISLIRSGRRWGHI